MKTFPNKALSNWISKKKISVKQFADIAGISLDYAYNILNFTRHPSDSVLNNINRITNIPVKDIFMSYIKTVPVDINTSNKKIESEKEILPPAPANTVSLLLGIDEAAFAIGISTRMLRKLIYSKEIGFVRIGNRYKFKGADISEYIEKNHSCVACRG